MRSEGPLRRQSQAPPRGAWWRIRGDGYKLKQQRNQRKKILPQEDSQVVEQAAWRNCAVYIHQGCQDLTVSRPEQTSLTF